MWCGRILAGAADPLVHGGRFFFHPVEVFPMSRNVLVLAAMVACGWALAQFSVAQKPDRATKPAAKVKPQYQLVSAGDRAVLLDAATGEQWVLVRFAGTGRAGWLPLKAPVRGAKAKELLAGVDKLAELRGPLAGRPGRYQYLPSDSDQDKLFDTASGRLYLRKPDPKKGDPNTWELAVKGAD
jgi:hypothetical protein